MTSPNQEPIDFRSQLEDVDLVHSIQDLTEELTALAPGHGALEESALEQAHEAAWERMAHAIGGIAALDDLISWKDAPNNLAYIYLFLDNMRVGTPEEPISPRRSISDDEITAFNIGINYGIISILRALGYQGTDSTSPTSQE